MITLFFISIKCVYLYQYKSYILSYTGFKVHLYLCMKAYTRELKKLLKNQMAGISEVEIMYS